MESVELTALTELDAVNTIIGTIGEAPIDTLDDMTDVDAINALRILRKVNRREQARGWTFNRVPHHILHPDNETKKIPWNSNYLFLKDNHGLKIIRKGDFVFDLVRQSFVFEHPLDVEIVLYVPFEYLPEQMRDFILAEACFDFQNSYFGDDALTKVTQTEVQQAWQYLQEFEIDNNSFSMLDNLKVRKLLMR